jgi:hypothetical protein
MTAARVLGIDDEARWREVLPARASVFGSVEFASIQREYGGVDPRLVALDAPGGPIGHALHLRPVSGLALSGDRRGELYDATTPPYSGPFAVGEIEDPIRAAFSEAVAKWTGEAGVVTEFGHLHPWKARTELLRGGDIELDREIVYVDLTLDEERLWRESFTHACRKNINRARREGVRVRAAETAADARELHRIYELTMDRQGALESYYFPPEYFVSFLERLPDNSRILLAEHEGRAVAATLYLHDETDAYSYLGGADHEAQRVRPTNAIVHEMIRWGRARGIRRLILGGGYAPDDGIMRFKSSFSPLRRPFHVYKRVHRPDAYAALCRAWRDRHGTDGAGSGFFPPYRAGPPQRAR